MAGASDPPRIPLIVGAHHRTGSLTLRDRLFVEDADVPSFLASLKERGIDQAVVLSTCDRVEVLTVSGNVEKDAAVLGDVLNHAGMPVQELSPSLVSLTKRMPCVTCSGSRHRWKALLWGSRKFWDKSRPATGLPEIRGWHRVIWKP